MSFSDHSMLKSVADKDKAIEDTERLEITTKTDMEEVDKDTITVAAVPHTNHSNFVLSAEEFSVRQRGKRLGVWTNVVIQAGQMIGPVGKPGNEVGHLFHDFYSSKRL